MAKERIISGQSAGDAEEQFNLSLRPQILDEYVGQPALVEKLRITLQAVKERNEPMEHVLLHGPPGLGKTTLAHLIAREMGTHCAITSGPALTKGADLVGTLTKLQRGDVLFIDEIHRLPVAVEEFIYPAMEDFQIDFTIDSGMHAKTIALKLKPFTLIGATTRAGLLSGPMRSRFGINHNLEYYGHGDLRRILHRSAGLLNIAAQPDTDAALAVIAERSRGTPRIANRLLRRVRDYAQVKHAGKLDGSVVDAALKLEGVDALGLDDLDRKYLRVIAEIYEGGPVGLEAVAATLGEDGGTLEAVVEPYLLQVGFLARTRKGRQLTRNATDYLGLPMPRALTEDASVE